METKITKWGNSFAVRLPKEAALELLRIGNKVKILSEKKQIIIRSISPNKEESLQNLVDRIGEDNKHGLFMLRDKPRGKEIW
ncbi:MAG: AbrB/MazE/SpoVT family DNA-binding domain-containing protein [Candidatus Taylorbacteria bacterium]|nr:AbrB/MazE/SpoVT family DNA-binding domain-containing protein [Candidatus Taylorbacteria bacterium]